MAKKHEAQLLLDFGTPLQAMEPEAQESSADSLYFAVLPDTDMAVRTVELAGRMDRQYRFSAKPRDHGLCHVTLRPLIRLSGKPKDDEIAFAAMQVASTIRQGSFTLVFNRVASFGNGDNRPLVLCSSEGEAELKALHRELDIGLRQVGIIPKQPFKLSPHMTLLYRCRRAIPEVKLDTPITWTVRDFVLIHSHYGKSEHEHVCSWPLLD